MGELVYALCAITSAVCAILLLRAYRRTRVRFLLWASVCFVTFVVQNVLLFIDIVMLPDVDLSLARASVGALAVAALLFGILNDGQ